MKCRTSFQILFLLICCGYAGTILASDIGNNSVTDANFVPTVVAGNTSFALSLYGKLTGDPNTPKTNLFFSPYSISTALAMTYGGARGETQKQMAATLHFTLPNQNLYSAFGSLQKQLTQNDKSRGYQLFLANALWLQKGDPFLKEFLDSTQYYGASLNQLDFANKTEQSRLKINSWVEEKTKNKIKDLIPQGGIGKNTAMVLTNAIYFKGIWESQFDSGETTNADFAVSAKKKAKVPMMHLKHDFKYCEYEKLQAIELPYKGNQINMIVLLPNDTQGIKAMEPTLTTKSLNDLLSKMRTTEVDVSFPKFKITWGTFSLKNSLMALGMRDAFEMGKADLSGINGKTNLFISDVFHKAFVEVNEEGTEAAAATGGVVAATAYIDIPIFRADHPFIFLIKDNRSGSILFMGRLMNPSE